MFESVPEIGIEVGIEKQRQNQKQKQKEEWAIERFELQGLALAPLDPSSDHVKDVEDVKDVDHVYAYGLA